VTAEAEAARPTNRLGTAPILRGLSLGDLIGADARGFDCLLADLRTRDNKAGWHWWWRIADVAICRGSPLDREAFPRGNFWSYFPHRVCRCAEAANGLAPWPDEDRACLAAIWWVDRTGI